MAWTTRATILGNPDFSDTPYRDYSPAQLAKLRDLGFNTVFVNLAWSRPELDAVTLEEAVRGQSFPWLGDQDRIATNAPRLRQRIANVVHAGLRPFFLWGCPRQIDLRTIAPEHHEDAQELIGAPVSRIDPSVAVACIQSTAVRGHYRELLREHFATFGETAGILFYTMDELAEVCDELDPCPRCHGVPLHERLPDFLRFLRTVIDELKPGVEMWWEPWELTATQTYAVVERLDPRIGLALHSNIHEVYFVNQADAWFRRICGLAHERGIAVIAELFVSGTGEDLGPVPSYPCPRLVFEQLRSVHVLPAVSGIKEYYGTVAEHVGINERMFAAFLRDPEQSYAALLAQTGTPYGSARYIVLSAWEQAARALEAYPWSLSWRLRHFNMERYDRERTGSYWNDAFVYTLLTPWTTPSWESSRRAAYIVSSSAEPVGERMLLETEQQFVQCIAHLDRALESLTSAVTRVAWSERADIERQRLSVTIFRHLTLARLWYLRADRLAAALRSDAEASGIAALREVLMQDLANARALQSTTEGRSDHNIDRAALHAAIRTMAADLTAFDTDPTGWVQEHFR